MVFTKELMAKGAAALGTAGVGGTGIYYAGDYLSGNSTHQGTPLISFMREKKGNNIAFDVKKGGQKVVIGSNEVDFHSENSFEVSVVAASKSNSEPEEGNAVPLDSSDPKLSCTFKFEVVGNYSNQTIKQDHKKRIFAKETGQGSGAIGLFGLLQNEMLTYRNDTSKPTTTWSKEDIFKVKEDFINNCGWHNQSSPDQPISIKFKVDGGGLVPADVQTFDKWFVSAKDSDKEYSYATMS